MSDTAIHLDPGGATRALAQAIRKLEQRFEATADNLANLETAGHKRLVARSLGYSAEAFGAELDSAKSSERPYARDFSQGALIPNEDDSDLALNGDGFFAIERDGELRYARGVHLAADAEGTLTDGRGGRLLGESGPVRLASPLSDWSIEKDGTVKSDGADVGRLRVVAFVDPQQLEPLGSGLFRAPDRAELVGAQSTQVIQGMRERSNSEAVRELVDLIIVQRQYDATQRALLAESELRQKLTESSG